MKKHIFSGVLASILLGVVLLGGTFAQELTGGTGFRVTDPLKSVTVNSGEAATENVALRNITEETQTARAIVEDFGPSGDESGTPQIITESEQTEPSPYSIKGFVQPIQDTVLAPGEEKTVDVTIAVPEDTSPGSYFGVVRFISLIDAQSDQEGAAVSLNASVGVIFLVTVPGPTVDSLSLEQIGVTAGGGDISRVLSSPADTLVLRIENDGNTFQAPFGDIRVSDWSGNTVQEINFNDSTPRSNVLPESIRRFEEPLENIGSFGRYSVEGFVSYGDGSNIIEVNTTFWVVPWVTVGAIVLILVALFFIGTRGIKAYNRSVIRKAKGKSEKSMR